MFVGIDVAKADAEAQELEALLARRRQLLEMLQAERNRLGQVFWKGQAPRAEEPQGAHRVSRARAPHDGYRSRRDGEEQSRVARA